MQVIQFVFSLIISQVISFYSLSVNDADGNTVAFSSFQGKKVLIVNTSVNSNDTIQYGKLEQLWQRDHDSLVILVVPSNDFGNAPDSISQIKSFIQAQYSTHFLIADKMHVSGVAISPLFSWLSEIEKNGMITSVVQSDFYKYLINKEGKLIGVFTNTTDPMGRIKWAVER